MVIHTMNAAPTETVLNRRLTPFAALLLTLSCLSPVFSVYGPGAAVLRESGTGAVALFTLGIAVAAVWGMIYAELGSAYPYAGGDYVGVGSILGPAAGFACLALWALTVLPLNAYFAELVATYARQVFPATPVWPWVYGALLGALAVALLAVRASALITGAFLAIELVSVLALVIAGFAHPAAGAWTAILHPRLPTAGGAVPVGAVALGLGAVTAAFATVGGNQAIVFGEELIYPHTNMGRVLLTACLLGAIATALPVIAVAIGAADDPAIFASATPFTAYVRLVAGPWAGSALNAAVALALFNALIAQIMFSARLWFSFARDRIFPAVLNTRLATVHGASGTPRIATVTVGLLSAACCGLGAHVLLVFISGLIVYALAFASAAVLLGRIRGRTGGPDRWRSPLFPLAPVLGLIVAYAFGAADWADTSVGRPSLLILGAALAAALVWYRVVLGRRPGGWAPRLEPVPSATADPSAASSTGAGGTAAR